MSLPKIFLSYSHRDEEARDQLMRFLKPLEQRGLVDFWADTRLVSGTLWHRQIEEALTSASVAVLLISQDFLASDFIVEQEVPSLLKRAVAEGMTLIPVFLSPSSVCEIDFPFPSPEGKIQLAQFQGVGSPSKTLKEMTRVERERKYTELAVQLKRLAAISRPPAYPASAASRGPEPSEGATPSLSEGMAPPPSRAKSATLLEDLGNVLKEKPLETGGALTGLLLGIPTVLGALGYLTLRAREHLIGLPPLDYPKPQWIVAGVDALWSLPRRGLGALAADYPTLRYSTWSLLGVLLALVAIRVVRSRQVAVRLALAGLTAIFLTLGGGFYAVAIRSKPPCSGFSSPAEITAFETCTWLTNEGEPNNQRREDLGGLLAWFVAAGSVAAWVTARPLDSTNLWAARLRRGLILFHLSLTGLFFLPLLPRAYAFGEWGLRYPVVKLAEGDSDCQPELADALADGTCCAVDISAGAIEQYLYVNGLGCPFGPIVSLQTKSTNGRECIESRSAGAVSKRVIQNGC